MINSFKAAILGNIIVIII